MSTKDNELLALKVFLVLIGISAFGYFLGGWAILIYKFYDSYLSF